MRKYISEFGLNALGNCCVLLQQDQLDNPQVLALEQKGIKFHIYMVCRRPRIGWEPESFVFEHDRVMGVITIQRGNTFERLPFEVPNLTGTDKITVKCPYPHTEYEYLNENGNRIGPVKSPMQ